MRVDSCPWEAGRDDSSEIFCVGISLPAGNRLRDKYSTKEDLTNHGRSQKESRDDVCEGWR